MLQAARHHPVWEELRGEAVAAWPFCKGFLLDEGGNGGYFPGQLLVLA